MIAALGVTFALCLAAVLWMASGLAGLLYIPLYALAVLPGLPLGFALFGRRKAPDGSRARCSGMG